MTIIEMSTFKLIIQPNSYAFEIFLYIKKKEAEEL